MKKWPFELNIKNLISFILLLVSIYALPSCGTSKKSKKNPQIVKSDDRPDQNQTDKPDSSGVIVPDLPPDGNTKVPDQNPQTTGPRIFNVALLLPLDAASAKIDNNSNLRFIQYYGGMKLAGRDLDTKGATINVHLIDTKEILNTDAFPIDLDVIIGPYASASSEVSKKDLQKIIEYGKDHQIMVVSPWYSNSRSTQNNPFYVQIKPNIREHFNKIVESIYFNENQDKVVLVGRDNDNDYKYLDYIQSVASAYAKNKTKEQALEQILIKESKIYSDESVFANLISRGKTIFVFPNYSFNDEEYLRGVLTKLLGEKGNQHVTAVGLPIVLESEHIGYNLYQGLNMQLVVTDFADKDNPEVKRFTKAYYEQYKTIPATDAFEGYDLFKFIGEALIRYGKKYSENWPFMHKYYLQTSFDIKPVFEEGSDKYDKIQFYENKHLDIIQFINGAFERL